MDREATPRRRCTDERGDEVTKAVRSFYVRVFYCYGFAFITLLCFLFKLPTLTIVFGGVSFVAFLLSILSARSVSLFPQDDKNDDDDDFSGDHPLPV